MPHDARRIAAGQVARLIEGRLMAAGVPERQDVLDELKRLKATFEAVSQAVDDPKPEGWTAGDPPMGKCSCNECVDKQIKQAKAEGRLADPTKE